eukprot:3400909-Amphidinium_carterae.1
MPAPCFTVADTTPMLTTSHNWFLITAFACMHMKPHQALRSSISFPHQARTAAASGHALWLPTPYGELRIKMPTTLFHVVLSF